MGPDAVDTIVLYIVLTTDVVATETVVCVTVDPGKNQHLFLRGLITHAQERSCANTTGELTCRGSNIRICDWDGRSIRADDCLNDGRS